MGVDYKMAHPLVDACQADMAKHQCGTQRNLLSFCNRITPILMRRKGT